MGNLHLGLSSIFRYGHFSKPPLGLEKTRISHGSWLKVGLIFLAKNMSAKKLLDYPPNKNRIKIESL